MPEPETNANGYDGLMQLVTPPVAPVGAHGDWAVVETALGTRLPVDYKRLGMGSGVGVATTGALLVRPSR